MLRNRKLSLFLWECNFILNFFCCIASFVPAAAKKLEFARCDAN